VIVAVAYPGPPGSHASAAAAVLFPADDLVPLTGFRAVADSVSAADTTHGVLPIESSLAGPVAETHDLLHDHALSIVAEAVLPIRHCLAAPQQVPLEEIRIVHSHPMALEQCRGLLARMPNARVLQMPTTAEAAQSVAAAGDPTHAAIAGSEAVSLYGLTVVADDVGDGPAFTRFVSIAPYTRVNVPWESSRISFSFVTSHRPGALHAAIEPFAHAGLDLVRLVARPIQGAPWSYRFDAVVSGHPMDTTVREALAELADRTRSHRILGVYEAAKESR
jgi:prephenate dehydratase